MKALGVLMILGGIALGFYVGLYLLFVGGIFSIINGVTADPVNANLIVWGAVRIIFASLAGTLSAWALILPGVAFLAKD